jgi:hypothetical protein
MTENLPHVKISRTGADEICLEVNGQKIEKVAGISLAMGELGSVVTIVMNVNEVDLDAELHRLLLAGADESSFGEPV